MVPKPLKDTYRKTIRMKGNSPGLSLPAKRLAEFGWIVGGEVRLVFDDERNEIRLTPLNQPDLLETFIAEPEWADWSGDKKEGYIKGAKARQDERKEQTLKALMRTLLKNKELREPATFLTLASFLKYLLDFGEMKCLHEITERAYNFDKQRPVTKCKICGHETDLGEVPLKF